MLAEILGEAGYVTGAVVANYNVGRTFGFQQGFDFFVESWHERWREQMDDAHFENRTGRTKRFTDAALVTDQALGLLDRRAAGRPFFLWLHYMDPHGPYVPPDGYAELFADAHPAEPVTVDVIPAYQRQHDPASGETITDLGFYKAQYDREIRYLDDELGRLLAGLESRDLLAGTVLVVTADHGESQGEHDYYLEHGRFSYQVNAHVPLFLVQEGRIPAGKVIEAPVGLIDLTPTLLALAGLPPAATHEGQDLLPLILGEPGATAPDYVFMESGYHPQTPQLTVRRGDWKLIHVQAAEDRAEMAGSAWELYDLAADPGETVNLAGEHPELVERLGMLLVDWYMGTPPPPPADEVDLEALDARDRELLRSLGY
jgi:arylsulfatase